MSIEKMEGINMSNKLCWDKLLCSERIRESSTKGNAKLSISDANYDHRNEFDKDYDRIVYSSSVRRLQDKAQVFPLQENDFTRTRLTHSLEASALGRSLGYAIGEWLLSEKHFSEYKQVRELSALLEVAALIHDLGNPPYGHYGEDIIRSWFNDWFKSSEFSLLEKSKILAQLTDQQKSDFILFEGNAQTLRIVSKLQLLNDEFGANFTYGTLATIIKYPWSSIDKKAQQKGKFGYFQSEEALAEDIYNHTGTGKGIKHPATFLLEAADDIAYLNADVEDGVKKGLIPWELEYKNIKSKLTKEYPETYNWLFEKLDKIGEENEKKGIQSNITDIQNFKIYSQGLMFKHAVKSFKNNYESIMDGHYYKDLLNDKEIIPLVKEMKRLAGKYCFSSSEVISLELVGDSVVKGLLDKFVCPIVKCESDIKTKTYEGKIYSLISENFKKVCCFDDDSKEFKKCISETTMYDRLLLITDYISGMTDSYAVNLYRELLGVKLP